MVLPIIAALGVGGIFAILMAFFIGLPVLLGGGGIALKIVQLLFFTEVGAFPVWALFVVFILGFIMLKKMRMRGYGI